MQRRAAEESLTDHGKDNSNGRAHVGDAIRHKPGILGFLRQITDRDNNSGLKTKEYTSADVPNPGDLNRRGVIKVGGEHKPTYVRLLVKRVPPQ